MTGMRIGGLASGMDIDSIVEKLMQAERMPLQKMEQDRTSLTWQRDAYREMNSLLFDLDSLIFDMKLSSSYQTKTVSSSNESYLTAIASASSANGSHTISNVQVAKAAYNISQGLGTNQGISADSTNKINANLSLWTEQNKFASNAFDWQTKLYQNADIKIGDKPKKEFKLAKGALDENYLINTVQNITVEDSNGVSTAYGIVTGTNKDAPTTLTENQVYINTNTGEMIFGKELDANSTIKGPEVSYNYISLSFTTYDTEGNIIDDSPNDSTDTEGYTFEFDGTMSLNQMMVKISNSGVGVSAFYDSQSDKVSFQRTQTGELSPTGTEIGMSGGFFTSIGMDATNEVAGRDATFTIDGLSTSRNSNTFTINGVTYTLKSDFTGSASVSVENDTNAAFENIKEFVDKYNEIIGKINDKLREDRYRDYKPLTDEQKKDMSDSEIELWEEKAKSGLLKGDNVLTSALSNMRGAFYNEVKSNDTFTHLFQVGIDTTADYLSGGKLAINESKLKEAIAQDPQAVYNLFSNSVDGDGRGIMDRLEDSIQDTMDRIEERAGKSTQTLQTYTLGKRLDDLNDRIASFQDKLILVEDRYWGQFTAMETAIQRFNSQAAFLSQQFIQ